MRYQVICYSRDVAYYEKALARLGHSMDNHSIANNLFGQTSKEEILEHVQRHYDMKPNHMWFIADPVIALIVSNAVRLQIDRNRVKLNILHLADGRYYDPDKRVSPAYGEMQNIAKITGVGLQGIQWTEFHTDESKARSRKAVQIVQNDGCNLPTYNFSKCLE